MRRASAVKESPLSPFTRWPRDLHSTKSDFRISSDSSVFLASNFNKENLRLNYYCPVVVMPTSSNHSEKNSTGFPTELKDEIGDKCDGQTGRTVGYEFGKSYESDDNQLDGKAGGASCSEETLPLRQRTACDPASGQVELEVPQDAAQAGRAAWGGKVEFLLTCVGYAVGLGNVWRFPYLCYKNGGGAFLIPYCLMLAVVGLPCFFLELSFGQFASLGPLTIWRISPLFKGLGVSMVMVSLIVSVYYNVVVAQCLYFLVASFTSRLPWHDCSHQWNTEKCVNFVKTDNGNSSKEETNTGNLASLMLTGFNCTFNSTDPGTKCKTPSEEYYENQVLQLTAGIEDFGKVNWFVLLSLLIAWIIVTLVLLKGVQSLGKVSYFTALFPYLMLTILLIRGATLPGAAKGVLFYLTPVWSRLADYKVWMEAATQIFFSLSCCNGGLIAMSSYNKFRNNCQRDAVMVALINCGTSVFAGFVIFCNLGFMSHQKGVPVEEVAKGGPGLAFIVYPEALTHMPLAPLWSVLFFIMMATLGFGSQFSIAETVLCALQDELKAKGLIGTSKLHSILLRVGVCAFLFALGIPMTFGGGMYLLNLIDNAVSTFPLLVCGLCEIIVLMYIYPYRQFAQDIKLMVGGKPNIYWRANWMVITPLVIVALILLMIIFNEPLTYGSYVYAQEFNILCILIGVFVIVWIPVYAVYKYCVEGGAILLREFLKPAVDWGPAQPEDRGQFLCNLDKTTDSLDGGGGGGAANFFQSKLSIAAELQRAASKESGLNRVRSHTNSFSQLQPSGSAAQFAGYFYDPQVIAAAANTQAAAAECDNPAHPGCNSATAAAAAHGDTLQVPFASFSVGPQQGKEDIQTAV